MLSCNVKGKTLITLLELLSLSLTSQKIEQLIAEGKAKAKLKQGLLVREKTFISFQTTINSCSICFLHFFS